MLFNRDIGESSCKWTQMYFSAPNSFQVSRPLRSHARLISALNRKKILFSLYFECIDQCMIIEPTLLLVVQMEHDVTFYVL